ncbi:MAG: hypothetical protein ACFE8B_06420 [Candidatus Hermodarchaeota archaeon]
MTQTYEKLMEMETSKVEHIEEQISEESKVDELLGDLNSRYFEESYSLEDAKQKMYCKDVTMGNNFDVFRTF